MRVHQKLDAVSNRHARRLAGAVAVCLGLAGLSACTTLLGIDGDYILALEGAGGERSDGAGGEADVGGGGTSGGGTSSGGKSSGSGGVTAPDAAPPEAGGSSPDAGPLGCRPGAYSGTFKGSHSTPVVAIPIDISGSTLSFRFEGTGNRLSIGDGAFQGDHTFGTFNGTLAGTFNCTTRKLTGTISGTFSVELPTLPPIPLRFDGTIDGNLVGDVLSGHWDEQQSTLASSTGQGTWSASWTGP